MVSNWPSLNRFKLSCTSFSVDRPLTCRHAHDSGNLGHGKHGHGKMVKGTVTGTVVMGIVVTGTVVRVMGIVVTGTVVRVMGIEVTGTVVMVKGIVVTGTVPVYLLTCQVRITAGDSGLCCVCVGFSSADLTPFWTVLFPPRVYGRLMSAACD